MPAPDPLLLGPSPHATRLASQVARVASTPRTTVLVRGERGRELEGTARLIHARSAPERARGPFVARVGRTTTDPEEAFLQAAGGTLFVDEVGELSPAAQARLLERLEQAAERSEAPRLIASTAQDLQQAVEEGAFREDLLYRLNVLAIRVPALRERPEDVPAIAASLLDGLRDVLGTAPRLDEDAQALLRAHPWSAGLVELEGVLACAVVATRSRETDGIGADVLAPLLGHTAGAGTLVPAAGLTARSLREVEEAAIRRVLDEEGGNRSRTARTLGINRTTLYNKLRQYGIA